MTKDEALKLALEALGNMVSAQSNPNRRDFPTIHDFGLAGRALSAVNEVLAQPDHGWTPERIAGMASLKALQDSRFEPKELNFCQRCGKRLGLGGIHTCTPPRGNT